MARLALGFPVGVGVGSPALAKTTFTLIKRFRLGVFKRSITMKAYFGRSQQALLLKKMNFFKFFALAARNSAENLTYCTIINNS